jgi:NADH-quinone oxidoreductase subunit M
VLIGTFTSDALPAVFGKPHFGHGLAAVAGLGVILGAVYMLWMVQRVFFGPLENEKNQKLKDLSLREAFVLTPMIIVVFLIGFFPNIFLSRVEPSISAFVDDIYTRAPQLDAQSIDQKKIKKEALEALKDKKVPPHMRHALKERPGGPPVLRPPVLGKPPRAQTPKKEVRDDHAH